MTDNEMIKEAENIANRLNRFSNRVSAFLAFFTMLGAVVFQMIRENGDPSREPMQLALLPFLLIPSILLCVSTFKKAPINRYISCGFIAQVLNFIIITFGYFTMPTYIYTLIDADIIIEVCFFGAVFNLIVILSKFKSAIKVSFVLNIFIYVMVIVYAVISLPRLSVIQNETVYYALANIFYFFSVLFNFKRIKTSDVEEFLNEDIDDFSELYEDEEIICDSIKIFYEVYIMKNIYGENAKSAINYYIWYMAMTEGKYLDYATENGLFGTDFIDKMLNDLLIFHNNCYAEEGNSHNEKLNDLYNALKLITECQDESRKEQLIYNFLLMIRVNRRFFTKG